jgi:LacI family transcriptional regulator
MTSGKKTSSIRDVAALAGVSVGTVSNVLNRPAAVAPETRRKVLAAVKSLGFVRNESARQLRTGNSRMIGLVVLDAANPFFTDIARGAEDVATAAGSQVVLGNSAEDPSREAGYLTMFEETRVQGLLITPTGDDGGHLERLRARGIPTVLVDRWVGSDEGCSVSVDDVHGGKLAVEHLIERGHEWIGVVGGPASIRQVAERRRGAQTAVKESGRQVRLDIFDTRGLNAAGGVVVGDKVASLAPVARPTALFACNDLLALGVLQSLTRHGIRVPDDIALIGYDDIDFAATAAVPLSSIRQPGEQLGRTAAELLLEEIHERDAHIHKQVVFTPSLVIRDSA